MKAIHASPKEIRKIFVDTYSIPQYQRPYSWEKEHCERLWEDVLDFYDKTESKDERYFLGNLVIHPAGDTFVVIDGQQRLTTILLLIKALHQKAATVTALEKCLKKEDPLTGVLINELRVSSHVISNDKDQLKDIVFNNGENLQDGNFLENFSYFQSAIDSYFKEINFNADSFNSLILTILDRVVLLPIHCESEDDALTIFETINNRGLSLSDSDIFKAKLYSVSSSKEEFIQFWNGLNGHEWLFRVHMHCDRAINNDFSKEVGLRSYFSKKDRLQDKYDFVLSSIGCYNAIHDWTDSPKVNAYWAILENYPNYYWKFPLYTYLRKHGGIGQSGAFELSPDKTQEFEKLIEAILKFVIIKGVVHNSVNAIRDTIYKAYTMIEKGANYIGELEAAGKVDIEQFSQRIGNSDLERYRRITVLLAAVLNENQDLQQYADAINRNIHIEHILPKKWNNYDGWDEDSWSEHLNTLGNLIPLEWNLNISAQNEYFDRKKVEYRKSAIKDVHNLCEYDAWKPEEVSARHNEMITRILNWIKE